MKTIQKKTVGLSLLVLTLSLSFLSFSTGKGGDVFEIYLNQQLVLQDRVYDSKGVKNISLQQGNYDDELNIKYLHCGQVGKSRTILLKDGKDRILRQWNFANTSLTGNKMSCKVKDILALKKTTGGALRLFYSSEELADGKLLATISI